MHSYPTDLAPVIVAAALTIGVLGLLLLTRYRSRTPRLRLLTGTRAQHMALRHALAPILREFLPLLERAGQEVRTVVLVPTLLNNDGEPLAAEIDQLSSSSVFVVRLAHRIGATLRQPDEVAGTLAENLLALYRQAAAVTVVRQTAGAIAVQNPPMPKPIGRNGLVPVARHSAQNEAEETVIAFKPNPLGPRNGQGA